MKFDVIVGNPPYQSINNGGGSVICGADQLYDKFMMKAIELKPSYISMIVPFKWCGLNNKVIKRFRQDMIESKHLEYIAVISDSTKVFEDICIDGGVMYYLYNNEKEFDSVEFHNIEVQDGQVVSKSKLLRRLDRYKIVQDNGSIDYIIVKDNTSVSIVNKVMIKAYDGVLNKIFGRNTFNIPTNFSGSRCNEDCLRVIGSKDSVQYIDRKDVTKNVDVIDKYKVITGILSPDRGGAGRSEVKRNVINRPILLEPGEVCTETYMVLRCFDSKDEAVNFISLLGTKFVRFLIDASLCSMHIQPKQFSFVPDLILDVEWTDGKLYNLYELSQDEIEHIENNIKEWKVE